MELETILETSEKIFFAKRYDDVKLDILADKLNIKKPTLYYYFKDKKNLFEKTLLYSAKKYIQSLDEILLKNNFEIFLDWYLLYPKENKNLFGIAFQKGYCLDENIKQIILNKKNIVDDKIREFLLNLNISKIKIFLLIKMLEKINIDNCIDGNCLKYDIRLLTQEIKEIFLGN